MATIKADYYNNAYVCYKLELTFFTMHYSINSKYQ